MLGPPPAPKERAKAGERRGAKRLRTVFRVAKVACERTSGLWRVRNISDFGMMLLTHVRVTVGERLSISLSDAIALDAKVVWCDGDRCGVEFDKPINSARILKALASERLGRKARPPRLQVSLPAVAYCERGIHAIRITDISQKGIGFTHDGCLKPGMQTLVMLEGGLERRGVVRWSANGHAGLLLLEPFTCEQLECIGTPATCPAVNAEAALLI